MGGIERIQFEKQENLTLSFCFTAYSLYKPGEFTFPLWISISKPIR